MYRFYIISEKLGLVGVRDVNEDATTLAIITAVNTGRTVYVHDRLTEV